VLEQWPSLEHVIADGGTGLENGVKWANERCRVQAQDRGVEPGPAITMGLDVLHSQRERERVLQRQWKQVERQVEEASAADAKGAQYKRRGRDARGGAGSAGRAWGKAERLFDEAVHVEEAVRQIETALVWFEAEGHLLSRGAAQQQLDKASEQLSGSQWSKVRRLLKDERSLSQVERLEKPRAAEVAEPQLREALTRLWVVSERLKHAKDAEVGRWGSLGAMEQVFCGRLCPQWQEVSMQVDELWRQAVRASSAVEGAALSGSAPRRPCTLGDESAPGRWPKTRPARATRLDWRVYPWVSSFFIKGYLRQVKTNKVVGRERAGTPAVYGLDGFASCCINS
jgi:hypothetical protein